MPNQRTDPEESLREVKLAESMASRGKLKIYLGAAPGVGKTYEMLHDARENRAKHLDVVVGIVESHGRETIDSMLSEFEIIPRQTIEYRGNTYAEFDLDAALKRNPGLILVDEMAHTNADGLRHEKRWQDIKELLDSGINVYTTLNVQHIESLKDDVAQIIQAPIKETVPDMMIERADTIELIDLPVDDLLKRLHEGKIYIPTQAEFAVDHYFRRGHLVALRELALRTTAATVETEVLLHRKSEGIKKIWPIKDKILVCVGANTESLKLIRIAKQMANSLQTEWLAVYVDVPQLSNAVHRRNLAIEHLRLAQQLGAETHVLIASDIVKEVMRFAREKNVTQIMVWKLAKKKWWHFFKRHVAEGILANCGEINVYIVTGDSEPRELIKKKIPAQPIVWKYYAIAVAVVMSSTLINLFLAPYVATSNLLMVYLLGVAFVALFGHFGSSIAVSALSVIAYDLFFLAPFEQLKVRDYADMLTLVIMFFVTQALSYFTLWKHRKAEMANQIQQQTGALYTFSRQLLLTRGLDALLMLGNAYIGDIFNANVKAFLPNKNQLQYRVNGHFKSNADEKEQSVAEWVYKMKQPAGFGTDTLSSTNALYLPLTSSAATVGVLKIEPKQDHLYTPEQRRLLDACVAQLTLAIEADRLQEKTRKKELKLEIDSARDNLLKNIVTHLNFPLQVILNAMHSDKTEKTWFDPTAVSNELSQISLMNSNMLTLMNFESETILLNKTTLSLHQILTDSITLFRKRSNHKPVHFHWPADIADTIVADGELLREVLRNLLDNAEKFSPYDAAIEMSVSEDENKLTVSIMNPSSKIAQGELTHLFKKFYRSTDSTAQQGLGLGLTLCQKIIEAHGGQIWAENLLEKGGVAFRFVLPILS